MWIWGVEVSSNIVNRSACHTNSGRSYNFPTWFNGPNMVLTSPTVSVVPNIWHVPTLVLSKYLLWTMKCCSYQIFIYPSLAIYLDARISRPISCYDVHCSHRGGQMHLYEAVIINYYNGAINNVQQQTGSQCHVSTCHVQVWTRVKCPRLNTFLWALTFILH